MPERESIDRPDRVFQELFDASQELRALLTTIIVDHSGSAEQKLEGRLHEHQVLERAAGSTSSQLKLTSGSRAVLAPRSRRVARAHATVPPPRDRQIPRSPWREEQRCQRNLFLSFLINLPKIITSPIGSKVAALRGIGSQRSRSVRKSEADPHTPWPAQRCCKTDLGG